MKRLVLALCLVGCSPAARQETAPASDGAKPQPTLEVAAPSAKVVPSSAPSSAARAVNAAAVTASAEPASAPAFAPPALSDADGKPLAQTEDKPSTTSPFFQAAAERLFSAIVKDDPELALSFFFPVSAYQQVKDVQNPARDWEQRLVRLFRRDVHEYHRALGKRRGEARFVRLEVPEARAEWMKPGREGNRVGYFRVLRSRLIYADADAKERALEVTSLISWRGEWYVVHLHGFE
jgi:hypothetical protein